MYSVTHCQIETEARHACCFSTAVDVLRTSAPRISPLAWLTHRIVRTSACTCVIDRCKALLNFHPLEIHLPLLSWQQPLTGVYKVHLNGNTYMPDASITCLPFTFWTFQIWTLNFCQCWTFSPDRCRKNYELRPLLTLTTGNACDEYFP